MKIFSRYHASSAKKKLVNQAKKMEVDWNPPLIEPLISSKALTKSVSRCQGQLVDGISPMVAFPVFIFWRGPRRIPSPDELL
jgi:hypothetical protein